MGALALRGLTTDDPRTMATVYAALRPTLVEGAAQAAVVDASLPDRLVDVRTSMVFPPVVSTLSLAFVTWLAVYKPWGVTPRGRRFLRVPAAQGSERPPAAAQRS